MVSDDEGLDGLWYPILPSYRNLSAMVLLRFGEMDFAMLLEQQMRIHKYNKINKLYDVDFIGYFISI